jgi:hypothetical protein
MLARVRMGITADGQASPQLAAKLQHGRGRVETEGVGAEACDVRIGMSRRQRSQRVLQDHRRRPGNRLMDDEEHGRPAGLGPLDDAAPRGCRLGGHDWPHPLRQVVVPTPMPAEGGGNERRPD